MKRVTAQAKKDKLISDLIRARGRLLDAARALTPEKRDEVFLGVWSTQDLLAHLAGWDFTNLAAARDILADKIPDFYAQHDRDWKTYNAHLVEEYKKDDFDEMIASVEASHRSLIDFLDTIAPEEFGKDRGLSVRGYKVTIARLLQAEIDDEEIHCRQIEEFASRSLPA